MDGSYTKIDSGANLMVDTPKGRKHEHVLKFMIRVSLEMVRCHVTGCTTLGNYKVQHNMHYNERLASC